MIVPSYILSVLITKAIAQPIRAVASPLDSIRNIATFSEHKRVCVRTEKCQIEGGLFAVIESGIRIFIRLFYRIAPTITLFTLLV